MEHKAYLHRSGRTARAGAEGVVVTVALDAQRRDVKDLLRMAKIDAALEPVEAHGAAVSTLVGEPAAHVKPAPVTSTPQQSRGGGRGGSGEGRSGGRNGGGSGEGRSGGRGSGRSGGAPRQGGESAPGRERQGQAAGGAKGRGGQSAGGKGRGGQSAAPRTAQAPAQRSSAQRYTTGSTVGDIQRGARTPNRRSRG
jgi:superfamily II DNA/RNA helicase